MTLYANGYKEVEVDLEIEDDEIIEYIQESHDRLEKFRKALGGDFGTAREFLDGLPSLDRDRFLADLCRECALLGIDWPSSPKDETAIIRKDGGK